MHAVLLQRAAVTVGRQLHLLHAEEQFLKHGLNSTVASQYAEIDPGVSSPLANAAARWSHIIINFCLILFDYLFASVEKKIMATYLVFLLNGQSVLVTL